MNNIPTILRLENVSCRRSVRCVWHSAVLSLQGAETGRLVEDEILDAAKLKEFVQ